MTMSTTSGYQVWVPSTTTTYNYIYNGDKLSQMTVGTASLTFTYDASGAPLSVIYDANTSDSTAGSVYYYVTNIQGDVIAILDDSGDVIAEYTYDAWGNPISGTETSAQAPHALATLNPLRYRSYLYDSEYGYYYLQSRYYNPEVGRFINADDYPTTGQGLTGNNMFAYCGNNPVARLDASGHFWEAIAIGFAVGIAGQYISDVIGNVKSGKTGASIFKPTSSATDYLASGLGGAIAAIPGMKLVGTVAVGAIGNVVSEGIKGNLNSVEDLGKSAMKGAVANGIGYGVSKGIAALKVKQIGRMSRSAKKIYLRDTFYGNSQSNVNVNLKTFSNSSMSANISILEMKIAIFRSGIYSTITSTIATLF